MTQGIYKEKLIVIQLVKILPRLYGNTEFITVLTEPIFINQVIYIWSAYG
jgi:hypothetical protein